jgi:Ice-binding-like
MRRSAISFSVAVLAVFGWPATALAATDPLLGTSGNYAVIASSTITDAGASWITGRMALSPGTSVTGFPPATSGPQDIANGAALQARNDARTAYYNAAGETPFSSLSSPGDIGGQRLIPGIYRFSSSVGLTGTVTLNGGGIYIFQIGSTLTTGSSSRVLLTNGAQPCDIFWQVGSSATIGGSTAFVGTILANTSITMVTAATLNGRAFAGLGAGGVGAVTLHSNRIIQPSGCGYPAPAFVSPPGGSILPGTLGGGVDQTISFGPLADKILGEPSFNITATASSGLPVSFTASGVCSVSGATVTLSGTGVCTITAAQAGNDSFNAASNVSQSFDVLSPAQFAQGVIDATSGMGLMSGTADSLTSKLEAYIASTARGNGTAACGQLGAFVNYVNAQSGKQITAADATILLTDEARLTTATGC